MLSENDAASRLELLLADIRDVFIKEGAVERGAEISSADIIKALVAIEGRPWAERGKNGKRGNPLTQTKLGPKRPPRSGTSRVVLAPGILALQQKRPRRRCARC